MLQTRATEIENWKLNGFSFFFLYDRCECWDPNWSPLGRQVLLFCCTSGYHFSYKALLAFSQIVPLNESFHRSGVGTYDSSVTSLIVLTLCCYATHVSHTCLSAPLLMPFCMFVLAGRCRVGNRCCRQSTQRCGVGARGSSDAVSGFVQVQTGGVNGLMFESALL